MPAAIMMGSVVVINISRLPVLPGPVSSAKIAPLVMENGRQTVLPQPGVGPSQLAHLPR